MDYGIRLRQFKTILSIFSGIISLILLQQSTKKHLMDVTSLERYSYGKKRY